MRRRRSTRYLPTLLTLAVGLVIAACSDASAPTPTGSLALSFNGLPAGTAVQATLTMGVVTKTVTSSSTLAGLDVGDWTLSASSVTVSGVEFAPQPISQTVVVPANAVGSAHVTWAPTTGSLVISVLNLPAGVDGEVQVQGPGVARVIAASTTLSGLAPGVYTLTARDVRGSAGTYRSVQSTQVVAVPASVTSSTATVTYSPAPAAVDVTVTGLPGNALADVTLVSPDGVTTAITGNARVGPVVAGRWRLNASSVQAEGFTYSPVPASRDTTVSAGDTLRLAVQYVRITGALAIAVTGLPGDLAGRVTVVEPSGATRLIAQTTTLLDLSPGTYTVRADTVVHDGLAWHPLPISQQVNVTASPSAAAATVAYASTSGSIDLVLEKAYVTQATQNPEGSVTLVAGRDALLLVFARSDRSNALSVPVRARIYDGSTLLQTTTLTRAGSVPTALSEGVLTSTWNLVISGANVRQSMRVLVDIDPTNAVTEVSETNNTWPADGAPGLINVVTVPAFNVRFVPVSVGNLTGNVTTANMNNFLALARLTWPLLDVSASVRTPFTSSADTLRANDSNGGWLTVLSELNTLRATDGASASLHYYGVVKVAYTSGAAGYGYVPGRAAMGWDLMPSADLVAAHEWGHNFNRPHAPCGGVAGPDPSFPYPGGRIGVLGWNATTNALLQATTSDLMGYCTPTWVSDYNWSRVLAYRQSSAIQLEAGATVDGLLVWGRVVDGAVQLEPAFRVTAPVTAASMRPTHRVEAVDSDGNVLFDLPIAAERVDHVTDHEELQFSVVLPWTASLEQALTGVRVRDVRTPLLTSGRTSETAVAAKRSRSTRSAPALVMPDPEPALEAMANGRTRVRWNSRQYPMAMVRDAATGAVMGYVRRSGDAIVSGGRKLEVVYSDGVRSVKR